MKTVYPLGKTDKAIMAMTGRDCPKSINLSQHELRVLQMAEQICEEANGLQHNLSEDNSYAWAAIYLREIIENSKHLHETIESIL